MIETTNGLSNINNILNEHSQRIEAIIFGSEDLSNELNCSNNRESLLYTSSYLINICSRFKIPIIDSPFFNLKNSKKLRKDTKYGKSIGFINRISIHPDQINIISEIYKPSKEEIINSKKIIKSFKDGVNTINGKMIDNAMLKKAYRNIKINNYVEKNNKK